jgi:hypothetical protein
MHREALAAIDAEQQSLGEALRQSGAAPYMQAGKHPLMMMDAADLMTQVAEAALDKMKGVPSTPAPSGRPRKERAKRAAAAAMHAYRRLTGKSPSVNSVPFMDFCTEIFDALGIGNPERHVREITSRTKPRKKS